MRYFAIINMATFNSRPTTAINYQKTYYLPQTPGSPIIAGIGNYGYMNIGSDYLIEYQVRSGETFTYDKFYGKFMDIMIDSITSHDVCIFEVYYSIREWSENMLYVNGHEILKISDDVLLLEEFAQKCHKIDGKK